MLDTQESSSLELEPGKVIIDDESLVSGFTSVPNQILTNSELSIPARLTYVMLLKYAWEKDSCFPGQDRLAQDLGVTRKAVNKYLRELKEKGFVSWKRQGMGKTNEYHILKEKVSQKSDVTKRLHMDVTKRLQQVGNGRLHKEYSVEEDSDKNKILSKFEGSATKKKIGKKADLEVSEEIESKSGDRGEQPFSEDIAAIVIDFTKQILHDPDHIYSNQTQAMNLWRSSELSEDDFIDLLTEAKKLTLKNTGNIRKKAGYAGLKNRAPYFFQVVKDLLSKKRLAELEEKRKAVLNGHSF